jgi:CheY-like chemotaxis protein
VLLYASDELIVMLLTQAGIARMKNESKGYSDQVRILIAEDFLQWRIRIRSMLQAVPQWKIVFEATDGVTAVQKAAELLPHIVILDVGLPLLNGIEAATQIRQCSPDSKIIFATTESDWDVRKAAMEAGAEGYVRKADVERKLVPAIAAALQWDGSGGAHLFPRKLFDKLAVPLRLDVFFNFLLHPGAKSRRLSSYEGIPQSEAEQIDTLEFGQAVCGTVALTRKPILIRNVLNVEDEKVRLIQQYGVQVYNCNPLLDGDRLLGTLSFGSRQRVDFDDSELRLMQDACAEVARRLTVVMPPETDA